MGARARFPDDFYIHALRGARKLSSSQTRQIMGKRAAYLAERIEQARLDEKPFGLYLNELVAIAQLVEPLEAARQWCGMSWRCGDVMHKCSRPKGHDAQPGDWHTCHCGTSRVPVEETEDESAA